MSIFSDAWNILEKVADVVTWPMRALDEQIFGPPVPAQLPPIDANPEEKLKKGLKTKVLILAGIVAAAWILSRKK